MPQGTNPYNRDRYVVTPGLYHYHPGDVFYPGNGNAVFDPVWGLPLDAVNGIGTVAGNAPRTAQPPMLFASKTVPLAGLGGLTAGQMLNQPLNVPTTTNGSE